ncbi:pyrimidine-nucleoside phosphorylase [Paenibacillus sp. CGMCC 1.16610]|uniref:Pyrimidine-nucleoside phosphorylase n=1 Tax=Paenibacillus anseongense TaxID=2682845 RepID=A0ABW9U7G5_9BACL|nr:MULTISPECIES: pyrimidine-nucleoside phosphorylase [Paenibacillus]MBA2942209.1 pyrimidine-nucleoside phosphorylase [Paenibacillus sp. CGMCC 1.16610]MVQ36042.1 pyrimidine-nucleoside phosphorylase [Paenibacillus anseongense]
MRMVDLIHKKRSGEVLTEQEITFIVQGYTKGDIPDYQMSALLMAIFFNGMISEEISALTMAMAGSGEMIDLSEIAGIKVDKHSTGGVGDKISLIVGPIVASLGVPVAKMSGRGLGHTGGTVDKLESIPGFRIELSKEDFITAVNTNKIAIVGQSGNLAPADKKMYALRDVTATVDSIPLIASSIMSKKIASGADAIVLDVKIGSGAFMKTVDDARVLARTMVDIGVKLNRNTIAMITDMEQPLGREIGNANEIRESIEVLRGTGDKELTEVAISVAAYMSLLGKVFESFEEAQEAVRDIVMNGKALETFKRFVASQGGDPRVVDQPELLPTASYRFEVPAERDGYVNQIDAEQIGIAAMLLGAGRAKKEDQIDYAVGLTLNKKIGDAVQTGESICTIHANREDVQEVTAMIQGAYRIAAGQPAPVQLIYDVIV